MKTHLLLLLFHWRRHRRLSSTTHSTQTNNDNDDEILLLLLRSQEKFVHSRNRKVFHNTLSFIERRRRSNKIPRPSLLDVDKSSWRQLYNSQDDSALITLTGFDFLSFEELHVMFAPYFNGLSPHNSHGEIKAMKGTGRTRQFSSRDCLALYLAWTRTRGPSFVLSILFAITGSAVSTYLRFARRLLVQVLEREKNAVVKIPSEEQIILYKAPV